MTPEARARQTIDALLMQAGWHVCDVADANIHAARGVAIREFPLETGHGFADYLLYIDGKAAGVIEAKKEGATLTGVEVAVGPLRPGPARQRCPPGAGRCPSSTSPPASKPTSPTASTPSRAPARRSPSTGPRLLAAMADAACLAPAGARHRRSGTADAAAAGFAAADLPAPVPANLPPLVEARPLAGADHAPSATWKPASPPTSRAP